MPPTGELSLDASNEVHVTTENDFRLLFSFGTGKFRRSGYYWFLLGVAVLFCRVCTLVHLDGAHCSYSPLHCVSE